MNIPKSAKDWIISVCIGIFIGIVGNAIWAGIVRFAPRVSIAVSAEVLYFIVVSIGALFAGRYLERRQMATPRIDALARKHGIHISSPGVAASLIGETLSVHLSIFTCTMIELKYIRVIVLASGIAGVTLESAEPHRVGPWMDLEKVLQKNVTQVEIAALRQPGTINLRVNAKFEDNIERDFSIGTVLLKY